MLTCKEASFLASKKLDGTLTVKEHIKFLLHSLLCQLCRRYAKEINALHQLIQTIAKKEEIILSENAKLSQQSRERIKQKIDHALHISER